MDVEVVEIKGVRVTSATGKNETEILSGVVAVNAVDGGF